MDKPLSEKEKESVRHKFDSYCKEVIKGTSSNYNKKIKYLAEHEISIFELPENKYTPVQTDEYFQQNYFFEVSGENILVKGDYIARIINLLPAVQREIILLSYFTDMTDAEISKKLNMVRQTVQYQRRAALKTLKEIVGEEHHEKT
jgi:DNA-directed RNA polymerase specialized sigma24 family protein